MTFPICAGLLILPAQIFLHRAVAAQETIMSNTRQTAFPTSSKTQRESRRGTGACAAAGPAHFSPRVGHVLKFSEGCYIAVAPDGQRFLASSPADGKRVIAIVSPRRKARAKRRGAP
jgi:hypothetical protein